MSVRFSGAVMSDGVVEHIKSQMPISNDHNSLVRRRRIGHCDLPFDLAQGGELVEPFDICDL